VARHARLLDPHQRPLDERHFDRYARSARRHNSLLIVTFDENAGGRVKPIFTIIVGANVRPGVSGKRLNHYRLLRTI
jgi:phosphatidylinositol-3-phosphatase